VTIDERIRIETSTHSQSDWTVARMKVRGIGPEALSVVPRPFQPVTVLGEHELGVGDTVFERRYRVRGQDGFAAVWVGSEVRQAILVLGESELAVYKGEARGMMRGSEHPRGRVDALVRAVELLATRGVRLKEAWDAAAAALGGTSRDTGAWLPDGSSMIDAPFRGRAVTIDAIRGPKPPRPVYTRVRCETRARVRVKVDGDRIHGVDDEPTRRAIAALRPAAIRTDDGIAILLDGFVADVERLQAAMSIAVTLSGDDTARAPYR
jgi:hypothetical protein